MADQQENQHHLSSTPVDVAIKALQCQVDQLKRIVIHSDESADNNASNGDNEQELKEQIKALQIANAKADYRIKMLLRTLEEKDKK